MKVHLFNHWFKYKVPVDTHHERIANRLDSDNPPIRYWQWLDQEFDVGQYYNRKEGQNYLVFHNREHYLTFLLKL
jgi:endonuclease III